MQKTNTQKYIEEVFYSNLNQLGQVTQSTKRLIEEHIPYYTSSLYGTNIEENLITINFSNIIATVTNDVSDKTNFVFRRTWVPKSLTTHLFSKPEQTSSTFLPEETYVWQKINGKSNITFASTTEEMLLRGTIEKLQQTGSSIEIYPLWTKIYPDSEISNDRILNSEGYSYEWVVPSDTNLINRKIHTAFCGYSLLDENQKDSSELNSVHGLAFVSGIYTKKSFGTNQTKENLFSLDQNVAFRLVLEIKNVDVSNVYVPVTGSDVTYPPLDENFKSKLHSSYLCRIIKPKINYVDTQTIKLSDAIVPLYNKRAGRSIGSVADSTIIPPEFHNLIFNQNIAGVEYSSYAGVISNTQPYAMLGEFINWNILEETGEDTRNWPGKVIQQWSAETQSMENYNIEVDLSVYPCYKPYTIFCFPFTPLHISKAFYNKQTNSYICVSDTFSFDSNVLTEDLTDLALCIEETVSTELNENTNDSLTIGITHKEYKDIKQSVKLMLVVE